MDIAEGIKALVLGFSTTFLVLILISMIISLLKYLKPAEKKQVTDKVIDSQVPVVSIPEADNEDKNLELIAVITAAIAASLDTTVDKLRVTSFRKMNINGRWK